MIHIHNFVKKKKNKKQDFFFKVYIHKKNFKLENFNSHSFLLKNQQ